MQHSERGFYMVWRADGDLPTVPHNTQAQAEAEAMRLARKHPGHRFVVLQAVRAIVKRDVDVINLEADDESPF